MWRSRRLSTSANRFDNYREIVARFSSTGACGHSIVQGDVIGYHRTHGAMCEDCWESWTAENREADRSEAQFWFGGYETEREM